MASSQPLIELQRSNHAYAVSDSDKSNATVSKTENAACGVFEALKAVGRRLAEFFYRVQWAVIGRLLGNDALRQRVDAIASCASFSQVVPLISADVQRDQGDRKAFVKSVVEAIGKIPVGDLNDVLSKALQVDSPEMQPEIIEILTRMSPEDRGPYVDYLKEKSSHQRNLDISDLDRVRRANPERPQLMNEVAKLAARQNPDQNQKTIFELTSDYLSELSLKPNRSALLCLSDTQPIIP